MAKVASAPASFDALRHELHQHYDALSPHLQRVARYALDDPNAFALETVAAIAAATGVQPSTLIRFAKEFGYSGFSEMQRVFRLRLIEGAPVYRERIYQHRAPLEVAATDDPLALLHEFADASILCLERLKAATPGDKLKQALEMMDGARHIYVIGQRRAFPLAAYMAYGLTRLEYRCQLLDYVGGMVPQQVATLGGDDLLVAVAFAEYTPSVVEVVQDAHIRGIPTLCVTDVPSSPLARHASLFFTVDDADIHRFRPVAGSMALIQSLIISLGYYRDARKAETAAEASPRMSRRRA